MERSKNSFYTTKEMKLLGFKALGENVLLSRNTSVYGAANIAIGSNVRIDDFCVISGQITIGNYCHVAAHCALYGQFGIVLKDFAGISPRTTLLSSTDDFSGDYLTGPTVDAQFTNVRGGSIEIGKHAVVGAGCVVLPSVIIGEGSAVGTMSIVNRSLPPWGIYVGQPARFLKARSKKLLELELEFAQFKV